MSATDPHGFTVIVQRLDTGGGHSCTGIEGVPLAVPVRVAVLSDPAAIAWRDDLAQRILDSFVATAGRPPDPCRGGAWLGCWATDAPVVAQLLVVVTSTNAPTQELEDRTTEWLARGLDAVGVVRSGDNPDHVLPPALRSTHALQWSSYPGEVVDGVLDMALLGGDGRRAFISYSHRDGDAHAVDVQRELSARRFDVFLDRFVLDPGADFIERIEDELLDKAMVVVVETPAATRSTWVQREIGTAINRALTVLAYNPHGTAGFVEIGEANRFRTLAALGQQVERRHRDGLVARRRSLHESLRQALLDAGAAVTDLSWTAHGCRVRATHEVTVTLRPADLRRFRLLGERASGARPVLIHPRPFSAPRRRDLDWLRGISGVVDVDEGRLVDAATGIVTGAL